MIFSSEQIRRLDIANRLLPECMPSIELGLFILLEHEMVVAPTEQRTGSHTRNGPRRAWSPALSFILLDDMSTPPGSSRKTRCAPAARIAFGNLISSKRPSRQWGRWRGTSGCVKRLRTMSGNPNAAGNNQNAIWGSSFQSGRCLPLST